MQAMPLLWWLRPVTMHGAARRAQRRRVHVAVPQAVGGEGVEVRRRDRAAVAAQLAEPGVVEDDEQDVRGALPGTRRCRPRRARLVGRPANHAGERRSRGIFDDRHRGLLGCGGVCVNAGATRPAAAPLLPGPQLDPDVAEPAPDVPVDRRRTERHRLVERPLGRVQDERLRLRAAQAAVGADQLLVRRDLAELRVVLADEQEVRRVGHRVLALHAHDRVRPEQGGGVLAVDVVLVEVPDALRAEDDRAALARADHEHRHARMGGECRDEPRVQLLELLDRQPVVVPREPDKAEVAGADHRDRRRVRGRRDLFRIEVDDAVFRRAGERDARDARADAPAPRDLRQERVDEGRALGLRLRLEELRAAGHEVADHLAEALVVALLERRAQALAVVGEDDEVVGTGSVLRGLPDRREGAVDAVERLERLDALRAAVVRELVVVGEVGVDDVRCRGTSPR